MENENSSPLMERDFALALIIATLASITKSFPEAQRDVVATELAKFGQPYVEKAETPEQQAQAATFSVLAEVARGNWAAIPGVLSPLLRPNKGPNTPTSE